MSIYLHIRVRCKRLKHAVFLEKPLHVVRRLSPESRAQYSSRPRGRAPSPGLARHGAFICFHCYQALIGLQGFWALYSAGVSCEVMVIPWCNSFPFKHTQATSQQFLTMPWAARGPTPQAFPRCNQGALSLEKTTLAIRRLSSWQVTRLDQLHTATGHVPSKINKALHLPWKDVSVHHTFAQALWPEEGPSGMHPRCVHLRLITAT